MSNPFHRAALVLQVLLLLAASACTAETDDTVSAQTDESAGQSAAPVVPQTAETGAARTVESVADLKIKDGERGKTLDVRVTYPQGNGPFPVILFSHGAGSSKDDYQPLMRAWAAHGYAALQVNHEDSGSGDLAGRVQAWESRPLDLSALIDHFDDIESQVPDLRGKLDRDRIGASGHSFGGQTTQMIGGYKMYDKHGARDDRVKAVVLLAPPGGSRGDSPHSWSEMRLPMLTVTGGADPGQGTEEGPLWRMEAYRNAPSKDDFTIVVDKSDHLLGGITDERAGLAVPKHDDQFRLVVDATTAFFDAYLKGDANACGAFASGEIVAKAKTEARFLSKSGVKLRSASAADQPQFATKSESLVQKYDLNGDGVMQRDEAPSRLPDRAFDNLDTDGDGVLSVTEAQPLSDRLQSKSRGGGGRAGRARDGGTSESAAPASTQMEPITETKSAATAVCHVPT